MTTPKRAAAAPPVSLEGLEQHTAELEANVQALWKSSVPVEAFLPVAEKVDSHDRGLDYLSDTTERLDNEKVDKSSANVVSNDFELKQDNKTRLATVSGTLGLYHLPFAIHGHQAISRDYAEHHFLAKADAPEPDTKAYLPRDRRFVDGQPGL